MGAGPRSAFRFPPLREHGKANSLHLAQKSAYDLSSLLMLERPLRPFFVSPASTLTAPQSAASFTSTYPVICCSASKLAEEADGMERARGFSYVQGSGDDHEAWSKGLTPTIFWKHATEILMAGREEIDEVIARILLEEFSIKEKEESAVAAAPSSVATFSPIRSTNLSFAFAVDAASLPSAPSPTAPFITIAASKTASSSLPPMSAETGTAPRPIDLVVRPGKAGYAAFFDSSSNSRLSHALSAATNKLQSIEEVRVAVLKNEEGNQSEANDLGVAFALVLLSTSFAAPSLVTFLIALFCLQPAPSTPTPPYFRPTPPVQLARSPPFRLCLFLPNFPPFLYSHEGPYPRSPTLAARGLPDGQPGASEPKQSERAADVPAVASPSAGGVTQKYCDVMLTPKRQEEKLTTQDPPSTSCPSSNRL